MMTLRQDLIAAKALIDTPEKWWKAPDENSFPPSGKKCVMYAVSAIAGKTNNSRLPKMRSALFRALPAVWKKETCPVVAFNDAPTTGHADIMALFDRAINEAP